MQSLIRKSKRRSKPSATTVPTWETIRPRASRVIAAYLRHWGFRDPQLIAELCSRWTSDDDAAIATQPGLTPAAAEKAMIERAIAELDGWLDRLTKHAGAASNEVAALRGLVALETQANIDSSMQAAEAIDGLPVLPAELLRSLPQHALPRAGFTFMPEQSLGDLPAVLRPRSWLKVFEPVSSAMTRMIGLARSGGSPQ